jgi:hypothetical protein
MASSSLFNARSTVPVFPQLHPRRPRHFFSYTETDKEVSLILDESHVADFPKDALNVCNVIWRAVQIEPGESGLGKSVRSCTTFSSYCPLLPLLV